MTRCYTAPATPATLYFAGLALSFSYKDPDRLSAESRDLPVRHFKKGTDLHKLFEHATRKELAGINIYSFECAPCQDEILLKKGTRSLSPRGKRH